MFYDGTSLNWVANGLYSEDGHKLMELSSWNAAVSNNSLNRACRPLNNSACTHYTPRRTLDSVTTYSCPDTTFYLSQSDSYTLYYAYFSHYGQALTSDTIIYVPGDSNTWCKLKVDTRSNGYGTAFNIYVTNSETHIGNLCS